MPRQTLAPDRSTGYRRPVAPGLQPTRFDAVGPDLEIFIGTGGCMPLKFATLGFVVVTSLLAGCSSTGSDSSAEAAPVKADAPASNVVPGRCDAALAQFAIGKPASIELLQQVRTRSGSQDARILGPDDMVTLEYRSERVNVNTDASGKVTRINCG
ncbi:Lipoprotein [Pseudomonas cannabina pv. alisalensis]|nr:Lipoprotein [Pseudomonas cannabina pv. alisalensis]RMN77590.1 putative Lipoprotein [Pseudomonas cannabina pv. alisalensis]